MARPNAMTVRGPGSPSRRSSGNPGAVEVQVDETAGRVERPPGSDVERVAGRDERDDAVLADRPRLAGYDDDLVGGVAVEDEGLRARQRPRSAVPRRLGAHRDWVRGYAGLSDRQRPGPCPLDDRTEEPLLLRVVTRLPDRGGELGRGGEERSRGHHPAELFDDDRQLDRTEPQAARGLRDRQRGPTQLDHVLPQGVRRDAGLDHRPDQRHRAFTLEDHAHAVAKVLLLRRELQLHVGENRT